ncbi:hypothetical protein [Janthinobacterium sp. B9-8]|uniref:hypothetical protein n=1 Tax=Janthinobacterium sp. B9-8 TaxID=1236179 RepID=UPI00061CEC62|nr:hypothetical protein [Janthinobacterium sp. B9-8]AMC33884.1 hypothetical protein VN23_04350 [Janthinobacterium sp. B9-8]
MEWQPISSDALWDKINSACARMDADQLKLWEVIRITPEKWSQHTFGDLGGGFWVVAIFGEMVIWFNDIEDGFNRSNYKTYGTIEQYRCNQDELEWSVQQVMNLVSTGNDIGPFCGAPQPIGNDCA